jgi:putative two-component system response regulator
VLIVDDEPSVRLVLRRILDPKLFEVVEAQDGQIALELFERHGADLILSDLLMPRMTGTELLSQTKTLDDTVGFILLTGVGTMENAVEALRLQADDYLCKPFNIEEVRLSVDRALRHRRLIRENRYYQSHLESQVAEQAQQIENLFVDALIALANAVEARDGYTGGHTERVTRYAASTGRRMGMDPEAVRHLWVAGLLHDIGKIGIPDRILSKTGKLTAEEYADMKRHPLIGASIMERSAFLRPALPGVLHHHERWDGEGYPFGLRGEEISLEGRILSVADTFDAIVTTRSYRTMRSDSDAVAELRRCAGTQFDPSVVEAFIYAKEEGFPVDSGVPSFPTS